MSISVSTDISCHVDLADLLKGSYLLFDWLATVYSPEVFSKNQRLGRSMYRIKRLILSRRIIRARCTLIDWFRTLKLWFLHWPDRITRDSSNSKRNVWTLVIRRGSTHSKISKTAMFNQRPMGSPILNIFESNLLQWFHRYICQYKKFTQRPHGRKRFSG